MKATGIVRHLDDVGRLILPKELRQIMGFEVGTALEIFTDGDTVLIKRYEPLCVFCGRGESLVEHHGRRVCKICRGDLSATII
jgi:AbrB family transcriptional regulator, transcriptional pleiotropic regulator of transition state genes